MSNSARESQMKTRNPGITVPGEIVAWLDSIYPPDNWVPNMCWRDTDQKTVYVVVEYDGFVDYLRFCLKSKTHVVDLRLCVK